MGHIALSLSFTAMGDASVGLFWIACSLFARVTAVEGDIEAADRFGELLDWMQSGIDGAGLGTEQPLLRETFELRRLPHGNALFSKRHIPAGTTIAFLPVSRLIYDAVYSSHLQHIQGLPHNAQMTAWIIQQQRLGAASPWAPWVNMLPKQHSLPKNWDTTSLESHLQGSPFPRLVQGLSEITRREFEGFMGETGLLWEEYDWAHDVLATRSLFWNSTWVNDSKRSGALFPVLDLMSHGWPANIDKEFDKSRHALRVHATRLIKEGDEFLHAYFEPWRSSNSHILGAWGFAIEDARRTFDIHVSPASEGDNGVETSISETASDPSATVLLGYFRARAAPRQPLRLPFSLPEDWAGLADPNTGALYYWNTRTGEVTWERPGGGGDDEQGWGRLPVPPTVWSIETAALQQFQELLHSALKQYPQTLHEDRQLLTNSTLDSRMRATVLLRRDEKMVLAWWLRFIEHSLSRAGDPEDEVDARYLTLNPGPDDLRDHSEL